MYHFLELSFSFPVVVFSFGVALSFIYWLLVCSGTLDVDTGGVDVQAASAYEKALAEANKGLLVNLGLADVPVSVVLTLISLIGWLVSYFIQLLVIEQLSLGFFYFPLGFASGLVSLLVALITTALIASVFKPLIRKIKGPAPLPLFGQVAVVRSAVVTSDKGVALLDDGGAGLLLHVRSLTSTQYKRNDRVVIIHYIADEQIYHVVGESDFKG